MKTTLKLGTRKSLLAWAQSSWVARELIRFHQSQGLDLAIELVGIETQGDKNLSKPLSQMDGKEFFTAELDHALLKGEVDFTVHSMKDLSLDRPDGLKLAAIPTRELQHDIIVFNENVIDRLKNGLPIRIGTSSPRRLTLIPDFLSQALPRFSKLARPLLEFVEIRGNVNTRLGRIHEPESSAKKIDAVVLAFAGLERLALDEKAVIELARLMNHTRLMVLPLRENPTAPAQGALAIETHKDKPNVIKILSPMHDPITQGGVEKERAVLQEWGGGCHQKLGASWVSDGTNNGGHLHVRGQKYSGENITEIRGVSPSKVPSNYLKVETSEIFNFAVYPPSQEQKAVLDQSAAVFIAHIRAYEFLSPELKKSLGQKRIWVSGTQSWFKLAALGEWVEGCTENVGIKAVEKFVAKKLLNVTSPNLQDSRWSFITHSESLNMSPHFSFKISVFPTYTHHFKSIPPQLKEAHHLYWASGLAFTTIYENLSSPEEKTMFLKKAHACGTGRTLMVLRNHGVEPTYILPYDAPSLSSGNRE